MGSKENPVQHAGRRIGCSIVFDPNLFDSDGSARTPSNAHRVGDLARDCFAIGDLFVHWFCHPHGAAGNSQVFVQYDRWWSACLIVFKKMSLVLIARPTSSAHPWGSGLALCFHWFCIVLGQSPLPPHTHRVCGERKSSGISCLGVGLLDRV